MNREIKLLLEIKNGKKSFRPSEDSAEAACAFQPDAKCLVHCNQMGWLSKISSHTCKTNAEECYDLIYIPNGLSTEGERYLESKLNP